MIEVVFGQVQASSQIGQSVTSRSNDATGDEETIVDFTDLLLVPLLTDVFFFFLAGIADGLVLVPAAGLLSFLLTVIPGSKIK